MVSEGNIAMLTLRNETTTPANHVRRIAPPVLKQDHLFFLRNGLRDGFLQGGGDHQFAFFFRLQVTGIDQLNLREQDVSKALRQFHQSIFPIHCIVIRFQGRGGTSQYYFSAHFGCIVDGGIARMIAGCRILLLIRRIVFFITNNKFEILEGKKQG